MNCLKRVTRFTPFRLDGAAGSELTRRAVDTRLAAGWLKPSASLVGGCCGATPAHIAAVRMIML